MDEIKSKSQKKREADALQKVGVELIALSHEKLNALPLTEPLLQAITLAKSLKSHGAIRRQAQLIGKLMRSADHEAILTAYQVMLDESSAQTADFHLIERWRDRLIQNDKSALTEFINEFHPEDMQYLRQLIKKAMDEHTQAKHTGASKALFRYIRSQIQ